MVDESSFVAVKSRINIQCIPQLQKVEVVFLVGGGSVEAVAELRLVYHLTNILNDEFVNWNFLGSEKTPSFGAGSLHVEFELLAAVEILVLALVFGWAQHWIALNVQHCIVTVALDAARRQIVRPAVALAVVGIFELGEDSVGLDFPVWRRLIRFGCGLWCIAVLLLDDCVEPFHPLLGLIDGIRQLLLFILILTLAVAF